MTTEAEVTYDDRIAHWRVDVYRWEDGDWLHERGAGEYRTKSAAREAAARTGAGSVYLEKRNGDMHRRYPN